MRKYLIILSCILSACSGQVAGSSDPVFVADPFILEDNGTYYLYGTGNPDGIQVLISNDLKTWRSPEDNNLALHKDNSYGENRFWAPEVYKRGDKYIMYYTAECHICAAVSESPLGPFIQETQTPMAEGIDNSLFIDDDGKPYLFWVMWEEKLGNAIWSAQLEDDMMHIIPGTEQLCLHKSQDWEMVKLEVNEGPFVLKHNGTYYLTYSANCCSSHNYGVGYALSKSVNGPWEKYAGNPILQSPGELVGTGHHAFFRDAEGKLKVVFHSHYSKDKFVPRITHIGDAEFVTDSLGGTDILTILPESTMMTKTEGEPLLHINSGNGFSSYASHVKFMTDFWNGRHDDTMVYLYHDKEHLHFKFEVKDSTLMIKNSDDERSVDFSDRVEIFLGKDSKMNEYFCMEIDPQGKVMDYKAGFYRNFDFSWDCPVIDTEVSISEDGYTVHASLPLEWLKKEGLLSEKGDMLMGLFRADFIKGTEAEIDWYSWRNPDCPEPDFHIPSSLGSIRLIY